MNIDSIKLYPENVQSKYKQREKNVLEEYRLLGNSREKNVNRGYYSGSFTGNNEAATKTFQNLGNTFADKIFRSDKFHKLLNVFEEKTVVASALVSLVVAGVARPLTNLAMAGKNDKDDSIYAASHAISSAGIGFVMSSIIMAPFDNAFRKIKNNPKGYLKGLEELLQVESIGSRKLEKSKPYKKLSKIAQMAMDTLVMGVPKAMLTIALIPPILKYVFKLEKGKKHAPQGEPAKVQTEVKNDNVFKSMQKPTFANFKEGNK